jgi:O-antigen ligase
MHNSSQQLYQIEKFMKNKVWVYIYYVVLILVLASRQNVSSEPPMFLRLGFVAIVVAPALFSKEVCYPAIITLFFVLTSNGFSYSYMPYSLTLYFVITIIVGLLLTKGNFKSAPFFLLFFVVYMFVVDLFNGLVFNGLGPLFEKDIICMLLAIMFLVIINNNRDLALTRLPVCFMGITITLSLFFLLNKDKFAVNYQMSELQRIGWTDPNYFGMTIGMGTVIGLLQMLGKRWKENGIIEKTICIVAIVVSVPTLLLNASRGAILSVLLATTFLLLYSKVKIQYKVLFLLVAIVGVFFLYTNQYFDLLEYRVENETGTGSGRTEIWMSKLSAYFKGNVFEMLFGYGFRRGMNLTGRLLGFHNDYIGFLVNYGIVGLCFLLYMLYYPIKLVIHNNNNKIQVFVLMVYFATCLVTLEPLGLGVIAFHVFYLYALLLAQSKNVFIIE